MKNWQETEQIMQRAQAVLANGQSVALSVVTNIQGSTYRRPGAKLLIEPDGSMLGNISGGCLEEDVRENGLAVIQSGASRHVHYDTSDLEDTVWGLGLGCNGKIDLQIIPVSPRQDLEMISAACDLLQGNQRLVFQINTEGRCRLVLESDAETDSVEFEEKLEPPPTLLVLGAGDDARPLVQMAHQVGFRVLVADHRSGYLTENRFPQARQRIQVRAEDDSNDLDLNERVLAVVKTHTLQHDLAWVKRLATTKVPYIGLLGPRERRDEIRNQIDPAVQSRLYGPIGLDLGGEGPELVAQSIVSEALAVWHHRSGGHLRDRSGTIHERIGENKA